VTARKETPPHPPASKKIAPLSPAQQAALDERIRSNSPEVLKEVAASAQLDEDSALALLARRDLPGGTIEALSKNGAVMKHRKVIAAVVMHPRTPRHVSLPVARHLHTFELMQIALTPAVAADVKMAVDETIITRLEGISAGERLALAKRASGRVAAALLFDPEARVTEAALTSPYMTEAAIGKALMREEAPEHFVLMAAKHAKWSLRRDVQIALLRNDKTPLARVLAFAQALPTQTLRDTLSHTRLSANVKLYLLEELDRREKALQEKARRELGPAASES
jgi:hypothetical protein